MELLKYIKGDLFERILLESNFQQ